MSTSLASLNVLGVASADALKSAASGSGPSSQSQSSVANLSLWGGLDAADVVKSNSSATCSGGQAAVTGNAELVGLVAAGQSVLVSNPNLAISLPGGISLIVNEQTSSPSGNAGCITVNALHEHARRTGVGHGLETVPRESSRDQATSSSLPPSPVSRLPGPGGAWKQPTYWPCDVWCTGGVTLVWAFVRNLRTWFAMVREKAQAEAP